MMPRVRTQAHVIAVWDLAGSTGYFIQALGFTLEWSGDDDWRALVRDEVRVLLGRCPDAQPPSSLGDHAYFAAFATDDVDALHLDVSARGAIILSAPTDRPWGWREMAVATPEGHRMTFMQETG